jgi:hypothetical protein
MGAAPGADVDLTVSPDHSLVRLGNQGAARTVEVNAFVADKSTTTPVNGSMAGIALPSQHDLMVAVAPRLQHRPNRISFASATPQPRFQPYGVQKEFVRAGLFVIRLNDCISSRRVPKKSIAAQLRQIHTCIA